MHHFVAECIINAIMLYMFKLGNNMTRSIRVAETLYTSAERFGAVYNRSASKQLEFWAKIGKIAEENPDLSYEFIKELLLAKKEMEDGAIVPFKFD